MKALIMKIIRRLFSNMANECETSLLTFFEKNPKAVYLDCGCFDGKRTSVVAKIIKTNHVFGIDLDKRKVIKSNELKIKTSCGDLNKKLPYKNNIFDVITSFHSIEHLVHPDNFVKEVYRILKPGGYFVVYTPNLASWHNIFALILGIQPFSGPNIFKEKDLHKSKNIIDQMNISKELKSKVEQRDQEDGRHIKVMTYKTLVKLLKLNNFKIKKTKGFGYYPFPTVFSRILSKIDICHTHYVIIKAEK